MDDIIVSIVTPQDKLLIMMIERISRLEDQVQRYNDRIEQLLSISTFEYFSTYCTGKMENGNYIDLLPHISGIAKIIMKGISVSEMYTYLSNDNTDCSIIFRTKSKWMLKSVQDTMEPMLQHFPYAHFIHIRTFEQSTSLLQEYNNLDLDGISSL
jgi:hypothetical protein